MGEGHIYLMRGIEIRTLVVLFHQLLAEALKIYRRLRGLWA